MLYVNKSPLSPYSKKYAYFFSGGGTANIPGSFAADTLNELYQEIKLHRSLDPLFDVSWGRVVGPNKRILSNGQPIIEDNNG